ncbi:MAG: hypothetical protein C0444_10020 [Microbacterium sp.]|nr:hypothetical protein [Microbacterium sp.]MBA4345772.1 hypothetical protein [Microbacterium sp.]
MNEHSPDVALRKADAGDRIAAAALFARAFKRDPLIAAATDSAHDPRAARDSIFRASIAGTLLAGGELVLAERAGALIGVALIADPQGGTPLRAVRASIARLVSGVRFVMLSRRLAPGALRLLNDADLASRTLGPAAPHHVLVAVGVDEAARGLGVGRMLVERAVDHARRDPRSWGVRLETENPLNVERYARWGFVTRGVARLDRVDVHVMGHPTRFEVMDGEVQ